MTNAAWVVSPGLQALVEQWRPVLDAIPATVLITDARCRIVYMNVSNGFISREEVCGRHLWDMLTFEEAVRVRALVDRAQEGEILNYEMVGPGPNGTRAVYASTLGRLNVDHEEGGYVIFSRDVTSDRTAAAKMHTFFLCAPVGMLIIDTQGRITQSNLAAQAMFGCSERSLSHRSLAELADAADRPALERLLGDLVEGRREQGDCGLRLVRSDGSAWASQMSVSTVKNLDGHLEEIHIIIEDRTEKNLRDQQMAQAQKLEAIGQLAAGIAHEINTPLQYSGDLLEFVRTATTSLSPVLEGVRQLCAKGPQAPIDDLRGIVDDLSLAAEAADLEFTFANLSGAIEKAMHGLARVTHIVRAMKAFSHPGKQEKAPADVNEALQCTVEVSRGQWKGVAEVKLELAPDLPAVVSHVGQLNQVFLNLIVNAAQALEDVVGTRGTLGTITITTRLRERMVEIAIADDGPGIPDAHKHRVFEPFFTTKEVGRGTGQGLPVCYDVVVNGHGGRIFFESTVGKGTVFFVQLPVNAGERRL